MRQLKATDVLSQTEAKGILAICALNKLEKVKEIRKSFKVGNLKVSFHWRSSKNLWGRFGGGWQWALGFEATKRTLLLNCLIFSLTIHKVSRQFLSPLNNRL